ncbi:MAG: general secretion pathway protein GspK [Deltaproteobacteria bacterium]
MMTHRNSERGVILLITLIAVAILSILVVDFIYSSQIDAEISANTRDDLKARYIAKSGVYVVAGAMKNSALEEMGLASSSPASSAAGLGDEGRWAITFPPFPIGGGYLSVTVTDERSKVNLNALVSQSTNQVDQQTLAQVRELFRLLGVEGGKSSLFISSLVNWLDRSIEGSQIGNDQDPSGAAAGFYASLDKPYAIKDGALDSVAEIRFIEGMDDEFFTQIKDFVTVYPSDKKINFSTATKLVLMASVKAAAVSAIRGQGGATAQEVSDEVAENIAEAVIEARENNPVVDRRVVSQIARTTDTSLTIAPGLTGVALGPGRSDVFSVLSTGSFGEENPTVRVTNAVLKKAVSQGSRGVNIVSWKED